MPFSLEAEQSVLGAILIDPSCMDHLAGILSAEDFMLDVHFPDHLLKLLPESKQQAAIGVLSHDPRPSYQRKPDRIYGLTFAGFDIRFTVHEQTLTVCEVNMYL